MESQSYDAIIVGSGLGGLSCAAYLVKNGKKVLILEKNSFPGGYAAGFKKGDFSFDSCLHMVGTAGKGQNVEKLLGACGVTDKIRFFKLKYSFRAVFPEHDIRLPSGNLEDFIAIVAKSFPDEKEGLRKLLAEMANIYDDIYSFLYSTAPMWQQMPVFPFRYKYLFPMLKKTTAQLLEKHIRSEKLKAILMANYGYFGLPPSKANLYSVIGNTAYWLDGAYYPEGGSHSTPDAFADVIRQNGGDIIFGTEVTSIKVKKNRAIGVITKKGKEFIGENIVSNASAIETFFNLVGKEKLPSKFLQKLESMEPSISGFTVYLGLDESFSAELEDEDDHEIIVSETYDLDEDYARILRQDFERASFMIALYSNKDRSLTKGHKFVASIVQGQPYSYWKKFEEAYNVGNKEEYNNEKDRIASMLIRRAEKIVPNLSKHIELVESATPLTMKRYSGNFNGAFYGWANTVKQFLPADRLAKIPIEKLFLSSAWTFPGEGFSPAIACGIRLGRRLIGK